MRFRDPKLHLGAEAKLRKVERTYFKPFVVMVSPVYVKLPLNQKFVAIKAPLQFFTKDELQKWKSHEHFYLPGFVDQVSLFQSTGVQIRVLLSQQEQVKIQSFKNGKIVKENLRLPASSVKQNDQLLRLLGPLWGTMLAVEPFFASFCGNEVCDPFLPDTLARAENVSVKDFELAFVRSNTAVFFALHLGWRDTTALSQFRDWVFLKSIGAPTDHLEKALLASTQSGTRKITEIIRWVLKVVPKVDSVRVNKRVLKKFKIFSAQALVKRLERIEKENLHKSQISYSIFASEGIANAA